MKTFSFHDYNKNNCSNNKYECTTNHSELSTVLHHCRTACTVISEQLCWA